MKTVGTMRVDVVASQEEHYRSKRGKTLKEGDFKYM